MGYFTSFWRHWKTICRINSSHCTWKEMPCPNANRISGNALKLSSQNCPQCLLATLRSLLLWITFPLEWSFMMLLDSFFLVFCFLYSLCLIITLDHKAYGTWLDTGSEFVMHYLLRSNLYKVRSRGRYLFCQHSVPFFTFISGKFLLILQRTDGPTLIHGDI